MSIIDEYVPIAKPSVIGSSKITLEPYSSIPTEQEYTRGFVTRYFAQPFNRQENGIIEIDEVTYTGLSTNPFYRRLALEWKITGPDRNITVGKDKVVTGVSEANRLTVEEAETSFKGIRYLLTNYRQYWRPD